MLNLKSVLVGGRVESKEREREGQRRAAGPSGYGRVGWVILVP